MFKRCRIAVFILAPILGASTGVHAAALEVYGRLPSIEDVALSPDGSRLALVRTKGEDRTIVIVSLPEGGLVNTVHMGNFKLRHLTWADSEHLLITTSETGVAYGGAADNVWLDKSEWFRLTVCDLTRNTFKALPSPTNNQRFNIFGVLSGPAMVRRSGGHTLLFLPALYSSGNKVGRILFREDLQTGEQSTAREGTSSTEGWLVDEDGQVVAEKSYSESAQRWSLSVRRGNELSQIITAHEPIDVPRVIGFGPDEGTLLTESVTDGDAVWKLLSIKDGTLGPPLADGRVLDDPIEDFRTNRLIGARERADDAQYIFFNGLTQARWRAITRAFPGELVTLATYSGDFSEIVVRIEGTRDGLEYALVDMKTSHAQPLGEVYEGLGQPLEVRRVVYKAQDGLEIPGYLTLPRGREPKNLPLVVLPHGGPARQDTADFDWWSQALADQGYAVLRPNFRGSDLNWRFLSAGFGQWGRKMQSDLSDGVRYLAKEGIVDPARVCIVGASYGGYAALAGVTLDPGVYRCAISISGISDVKRMFRPDEYVGAGNISSRYWDRFMGAAGPDDRVLDEISPLRHVEAVRSPVLLIHGLDDTVVPFKQSSLMYDALKRAGKKVELVELKHEDHWLSRSETRLQMLQASVAFLRANNPPD